MAKEIMVEEQQEQQAVDRLETQEAQEAKRLEAQEAQRAKQKQADAQRLKTQEQQQQRQKLAEQERQKAQQQQQQKSNKLREERLQKDREAEQRQRQKSKQQQADKQYQKQKECEKSLARQRAEERRQKADQEREQDAQPEPDRGRNRDRDNERDAQEPDQDRPRDEQVDMRNPAFLSPSHDTKYGTLEFHADGKAIFTSWRDQAVEMASEEGCSKEQLADLIEKDHDHGEVGEKGKFYEKLFNDCNVRSAFNEKGEVEPWYTEHLEDMNRKLEERKAELLGYELPPAQAGKAKDQAVKAEVPDQETPQEPEQSDGKAVDGVEKAQGEPESPKNDDKEAPAQKDETSEKRDKGEPVKAPEPSRFSLSESAKRVLEAAGKNVNEVAVSEAKAPDQAAPKSHIAERVNEARQTVARPADVLGVPGRQQDKPAPVQNKSETIAQKQDVQTPAVQPSRPLIGQNLREHGQQAREDGRWKTQVHTEGRWTDANEHREFRQVASRSGLELPTPAAVPEQNPADVQRDKLPEGSAWVDHEKGVYLQKQTEFRYGTDFTDPGKRGQTVDVIRPAREAKTPSGDIERQTYMAENKSWVKFDDHNKAVADYLDAHLQEQPELTPEQKNEQGVGLKWSRGNEIDKEGHERPVFVNRDGGVRVVDRNPQQEAKWITRDDPQISLAKQVSQTYLRPSPAPVPSAEYEQTLGQELRDPEANQELQEAVVAEKAQELDLGSVEPAKAQNYEKPAQQAEIALEEKEAEQPEPAPQPEKAAESEYSFVDEMIGNQSASEKETVEPEKTAEKAPEVIEAEHAEPQERPRNEELRIQQAKEYSFVDELMADRPSPEPDMGEEQQKLRDENEREQ